MKNLFFFNQRSNAAAQATECAYTTGQKFGVNPTKTSTFGRLATYIGLVIVMLVTLGVGEMWAGTYTVVGVAMENANDYYPRISVNTGGGDGCGWWDWCFNDKKAGITFEGKKLYLAEWTDCWNGTDALYFQQFTTDCSTEKNYNSVHGEYTTVGTYNTKIWNYNESNSSGGSWYSALTMTQSKVYFDATGWSETDIDLCIAHMNYQAFYGMDNVEHTNLYYTNESYSWGDAMGFGVVGGYSRTDGQDATGNYWITDISDNAAEYTGFKNTALNNNGANYAYLVVNAGKAGQEPTVSSNSSYTTLLNSTQTIESYVSTDYGSSYSNANSKATITISSYAMTSQGASGATASNGSLSTSAKSTTVTAARTATTTLSVGDVADGYVFEGWYNSSNSLLSTETSYTYYPSGATTIRARFKNEVAHTVTISNYCTTTSTTISSSTRSIGESTAVNITAPTIEGYTFSNWTLENGVADQGSDLTANPISVKTLSSGTYSMRANYTEDLSSPWIVAGGNKIVTTGTTWRTTADANNSMVKKTGHSTESVVYFTVPITTVCSGDNNGNFQFKIYNTSTDKWYGLAADGSSYYFLKAEDGTEKSLVQDNKNIELRAYIAGDYELKLDYSTSTPKLTVSWPIYNQVRISAASPADGTNVGNFDLSSPVSNVRSVTRSLAANTTYTFKIMYNSDWYGYNSGAFTRNSSTSSNSLTLSTSGGDMTLTTDYAGDYTFNFNESTKVLSITYPTAYKVTWDVGDLKGNKYTITCKKYNTETAVVSNSTWIKSGDKVTFYAGSNDAANVVKAGYGWKGYYGASDGSGSQLSSQTGYSPAITSNTSIYACFYEVENYVTPYINGQGGMSPNGANCYVETPTSFTANPGTGYYFTGWEQRSGSLTIASPSATTTNVNATAASTLQANFSPRWSVVGTGAFGGWSAFGAHLFTSYAVVSTKDVGYNSITLAANTSYEIKVYDRANSTLYGGSANQTIDYAHSGAGNEYTIATTSSPKSVFIQSAAGGSYTLNWNLTDKKIAVVYPTSWYITTGVNDALGGSFTAEDNSSNNVYGGKFVANSANVVFTATPNTGYNFSGWYNESTCTTAYTAGTGVAFSGEGNSVMTLSGITADKTVYAKFTAKTYTVTLTRSGTGYGSGGTASVTATYNATLPAATMPTAANGYAFMGYYTEADGEGSQVINASGVVQTVDGYTDADKKWKRDAATELFAYFKQAEITELTLDNAMVAPSTTITVTPTISPTPTGTTAVCWELQYSNGTPLPSQPEFTPGVGNAVSFTAPAASATYKIQAKLRLDDCDGDVLDTKVASFQVAGEHTVTIQYQDADGRTIKASTEITGRPLAWTTLGDITPPTITGYTFARWDAGDGVSIKNGDSDPVTTTTTSSIQIKAVYDGTLTAVYNKKRLIYFYNTLNWSNVYVYFYKNNSYWNNSNGTGADNTYTFTNTPYSEQKHGQMLPIEEGSKIYYFDAEAAGVNASYTTVAFTELNQHGYGYFAQTDGVNNKVIRRDDYKSTTMPMYVPLADQTPTTMNGGLADYYNYGYWMNYPENSGYTLKIYDAWNATKETAAVRSFAFPYSGDLKMPLKMDVEFNEANHDYWFMIYRNDGTYLGNTYNFKQGWNEEQEITGGDNKSKITTSAPGNYTLTLTYHDENYYIDVDFPIASGDYRIYYSDNATWSQGAHTKNSWNHPSHSIAKATTEAKKDTVSFFIPKGDGISHTMKFQKASVTNEGVVSWSDVDGGGITIPSSITESGVYNFIVSQPAGGASISLEKVEPYTGNFYIRTDCAGNTKWDSFKNVDHQMTYSDYAEANSGYSHYYAHWVESGNNVSFTIANDYSMCISDTLVEDYGTTIANISNTGALNSGNASIRFMWNQSTNKISRAYISGSSIISDRFLVLEGDAKMFDENGKALTEAGGGKISGLNDYEMNLVDDQNFVYERTIKLQTTARGRLSAKYNNNTQYFIGSSGDFAEGTTVELLGGTASATKYSMRIVYDFKTNRLVNAYIPSGSDITENLAINADIMLVREHQNAGQQLTFDGGSLSKVQTVYGVMRFNRWTLNNKETTGGHSVVGDPKSAYERSLYWISFPFDVNLSDVFGFGTYGTDWIIQEYDGAERAAKGYWADSEGFWKYITNRRGVVLEAGKGYVLALDLDRMKDNNTSFWANNIEQVELFFPSAAAVENIQETDTEIDIPAHECTIAPRPGQTDDRRKKDSHWNIIGVPSYANYGETLKDGEDATITWNDDPETKDLPFLYEWNMVDNTYSVQSGTTYPFKSMHAYMVQYNGKLKWSLASATPPASPVVARHADAPQNIEFRLELQAGEKTADQTFVKMTTDEHISMAFDFNYDLSKQMNSGKANIYTMVEGYIQTAGNCLPMSEQTTVVPVGVKIAAEGDYTFAIPEGTEGVGVTLIDQETGIRTSLSALAYTVSLEPGTHNNRFVLEISPIQNIATEIETSDIGDQKSDVRKLLIDGLLYIVRDGKVYDARGARIE